MNPEISSTDRFVDRLSRNAALDPIADAIQPALAKSLEGSGDIETPVKDFLHGRWLGHALHPLVTDIPIGAWTITALFDALAVLGRADLDDAADITLGVGILGAFAAALTGWAEWADTKDEPKRLGLVHAGLNGSALTLYLLSLASRRANKRGIGKFFAFGGYTLMTGGAYLGGELAFGYGLGTKHTAAPIEPSTTYKVVCPADDVAEDATHPAMFENVPVLLTRRGKTISAVAATCTHRGAPLQDAKIDGDCVTCPWHGSRFNLIDGDVVEGPATYGLARFDARLRAGNVEVRRAFAG